MRRMAAVAIVVGLLAVGCGAADDASSDGAADTAPVAALLDTPEQVSTTLVAAGLPCALVPVAKDPDPLQIGPDDARNVEL